MLTSRNTISAETDRILAHRLKQLRWGLQIDEREAAHRADVSERSWRNWEALTVSMNTTSFLKIGRAVGCSFDWLIGAAGAPKRLRPESDGPDDDPDDGLDLPEELAA